MRDFVLVPLACLVVGLAAAAALMWAARAALEFLARLGLAPG